MVTITGFTKANLEEDFYIVGAIVVGLEGGIPLVKEGNLWSLPGGGSRKGEYPEVTLLHRIDSKLGVVVKFPEKIVFRKKISKDRYDFIVFEAEYFKGEIKADVNDDLFRIKLFSLDKIRKMLEGWEILPDHTEALRKYINDEEEAFGKVARDIFHKDIFK